MKKRISNAILAAALFAATVQAQANIDRVTVKWSDPSRPGLVEVTLLSGSISVKTHAGNDVIVEGTTVARRGRSQDPPPTGLRRIESNARGLTIEEANNVLTVSSRSFTEGGNIDIQVPVKTNLKLSTINGNAIVDGVEGAIEVTNTNGNVNLTNVSGSVVAHAMNGKLLATIREVTPNKTMSFSSMNSNIDVTLPPATKANLKYRADNGEVWSDFDIKAGASAPPVVEDTRNQGRNGRFRVETDRTTNATINGGGPDIEIRTFNGNIYLRKGK